MARVTVLGGGGFIGCNLVRRLVDDSHDVTAVDVQFPAFRSSALVGANLRRLDLIDANAAREAVAGADLVYHLAADMGGVAWFHGPQDWPASLTNGIITANVLRACTEAGTDRMVYTSSACAYATEIQQTPGVAPRLRESSHLSWGTPDAGYGQEKRYGLQLCERAPFDARVAICHTIFGPFQEHEGQRMKFPAAVATKAIAARTSRRLELWGSGRQMRSYLFIDDAVERFVTLGFDDRYNGPVNVGAQGAVTCEEVARMCLNIAGAPDAEIVTVPGPVGVWARDCDNRHWDATYGAAPVTALPAAFSEFVGWLDGVQRPETATRTQGVERAVRKPVTR
jgi:nucleoside-diphosphate-sugar epimerase